MLIIVPGKDPPHVNVLEHYLGKLTAPITDVSQHVWWEIQTIRYFIEQNARMAITGLHTTNIEAAKFPKPQPCLVSGEFYKNLYIGQRSLALMNWSSNCKRSGHDEVRRQSTMQSTSGVAGYRPALKHAVDILNTNSLSVIWAVNFSR